MRGRVFGRLTVIERAGSSAASNGVATWRCSCTCGNVKDIRGDKLRDGAARSCGCGSNAKTPGSAAIAGDLVRRNTIDENYRIVQVGAAP
jgi:hypothetical protein